MKLVDEWRHAWKWASVRLSALGALIMVLAEVAGQSWAALPPDLRAHIPHADTIALWLFVLIGVARVFKKGEKDNG